MYWVIAARMSNWICWQPFFQMLRVLEFKCRLKILTLLSQRWGEKGDMCCQPSPNCNSARNTICPRVVPVYRTLNFRIITPSSRCKESGSQYLSLWLGVLVVAYFNYGYTKSRKNHATSHVNCKSHQLHTFVERCKVIGATRATCFHHICADSHTSNHELEKFLAVPRSC